MFYLLECVFHHTTVFLRIFYLFLRSGAYINAIFESSLNRPHFFRSLKRIILFMHSMCDKKHFQNNSICKVTLAAAISQAGLAV